MLRRSLFDRFTDAPRGVAVAVHCRVAVAGVRSRGTLA